MQHCTRSRVVTTMTYNSLHHIICTLLLILAFPSSFVQKALAQTEDYIYVSPFGQNSNGGVSPASSVQTIQRAFDILSERYPAGTIERKTTIIIGPGTYRETPYGSGNNLYNLRLYVTATEAAPLIIKSAIPGTAILDGGIDIDPPFTSVDGFSNIWEVPLPQISPYTDTDAYGIFLNEIDTNTVLRLRASLADVERMSGSFFPDLPNKKVYIHPSDSQSADKHFYRTTFGYDGLILYSPSRPFEWVTFSGLVFTGFANRGVYINPAHHILFEDCVFSENRGIGLAPINSESFRITRSRFYHNGNVSTSPEGGHLSFAGNYVFNSLVDNCEFSDSETNGLRFYGTPWTDPNLTYSGTVFRNNLFKGKGSSPSMQFKGGVDGTHGEKLFNIGADPLAWFVCSGAAPVFNMAWITTLCNTENPNNLNFQTYTAYSDDAQFKEYFKTTFADPSHYDFRLQSSSEATLRRSTSTTSSLKFTDPVLGEKDLSAYQNRTPFQFYSNSSGDLWDGLGRKGRALYVSSSTSNTQGGFSVSSPITLNTALSLWYPGDTIYLLPGTYPIISLSGIKGSSERPYTISGYGDNGDSTNRVVVRGLSVYNSSYLTIRSLRLTESTIGNGLSIRYSNDITVEQNQIYKNSSAGIIIQPSLISYRISIVRNTISDNAGSAINCQTPSSSSAWKARIMGNIFSNNTGGAYTILMDTAERTSLPRFSGSPFYSFMYHSDANLFDSSDSYPLVTILDSSGRSTSYSSLQDWQTESSNESHSVLASSIFNDKTASDFRLQANSHYRYRGFEHNHFGFGGTLPDEAWYQLKNVKIESVTASTITVSYDSPGALRRGVAFYGEAGKSRAPIDADLNQSIIHEYYNYFSNHHVLTFRNLKPNTRYGIRVGIGTRPQHYGPEKDWEDSWRYGRNFRNAYPPPGTTYASLISDKQYRYDPRLPKSSSNDPHGYGFVWYDSNLSSLYGNGVNTGEILDVRTLPSDASPHFYFVDDKDGSDTSSGLSQTSAWKTISHATNIALPGDTIFVIPGTYHEEVFFKNSGISRKPIRLIGFRQSFLNPGVVVDPDDQPSIDGRNPVLAGSARETFSASSEFGINLLDKAWIEIQGFKLQNQITTLPIPLLDNGFTKKAQLSIYGGEHISLRDLFFDQSRHPESYGYGIGLFYTGEGISIQNISAINMVHGVYNNFGKDVRLENAAFGVTLFSPVVVRATVPDGEQPMRIRNSIFTSSIAQKKDYWATYDIAKGVATSTTLGSALDSDYNIYNFQDGYDYTGLLGRLEGNDTTVQTMLWKVSPTATLSGSYEKSFLSWQQSGIDLHSHSWGVYGDYLSGHTTVPTNPLVYGGYRTDTLCSGSTYSGAPWQMPYGENSSQYHHCEDYKFSDFTWHPEFVNGGSGAYLQKAGDPNVNNGYIGLDLRDPDNDGLFTYQEVEMGTDPNRADTDSDGIPDGYEYFAGLNPLVPNRSDSDGDGLSDYQEYINCKAGNGVCTHPLNYDTDGDGVADGQSANGLPDPLPTPVATEVPSLTPTATPNSSEVLQTPPKAKISLIRGGASAFLTPLKGQSATYIVSYQLIYRSSKKVSKRKSSIKKPSLLIRLNSNVTKITLSYHYKVRKSSKTLESPESPLVQKKTRNR